MRCLTLADALAARGARVAFVCATITPTLAGLMRARGHTLHPICAPPPELRRAGVEMSSWSAATQIADAVATEAVLRQTAPHWVVVDHYRLDDHWERHARNFAGRCAVIDDLANRAHDCDFLLDQTLGRDAVDYVPLVPAGCMMSVGSTFTLLRPEFAAAREQSLARRANARTHDRILISMGGTDLDGITARVVEATLDVAPSCALDVVLGADAPSLARVNELAREHAGVQVHLDTPHIAELMSNADLAIGAAGTTSWERCCLGLPAIVIVVAENQRFLAASLSAHEVAVVIDGLAELRAAVARLVDDGDALTKMSFNGAALVDGAGAGRVADRLVQLASAPHFAAGQ